MLKNSQAAQKGPDARRRPRAAGEAYSLYVEPAAEGANEADGPFSAACYVSLTLSPTRVTSRTAVNTLITTHEGSNSERRTLNFGLDG